MSNRQQRRDRGRERHLFVNDHGAVEIKALGNSELIDGSRLDKLLDGHQLDDAPAGQHVWAMFAVFRCPHPEAIAEHQTILDGESLLMVTGPGCYRCEQVYDPSVAAQPCTGDPT